jgi:chaperonin GroES
MEILADYILFKIDKEFEDEIILKNGLVLYKDVSYEPGRHKRLFGHVLSVPKLLTERRLREVDPGFPIPSINRTSDDLNWLYSHGATPEEFVYCSSPYLPKNIPYNKLEAEIKVGDKIYFDFMGTDSSNRVLETSYEHAGQPVFAIPYAKVWCVIRDGEIYPVSEHVMVEKMIREDGLEYLPEINGYGYMRDTGLVEELGISPEYLKGKVIFSAKPLKGEKQQFQPGDEVIFLPNCDADATIEGRSYHVMKHHEIISKIMTNRLIPSGDRVCVEPKEAQSKTRTGLYIPDTAKKKPNIGTVITVGRDVKYIKPGEEVVYEKYAGTEVGLNGKEYMIMREGDILMHGEIDQPLTLDVLKGISNE